jgi:transposase
MTNSYIIALRASGSREHVFIHRELRRYEVAAARFREAGLLAYAGLYDGYAQQARLEIEALAKVDQRIADLDAELRGEDNPFANAEFAPRHEDLPVKVRA